MQSSLIYLIGFPGVGKLTIAREIARLSDAIVVDNQLINMPVMSLFGWDGETRMPPGIWDRIALVRDAVFDTLTELAPPSLSYVLTNVLEDDAEAHEMFDRVASIATRRGAVFVPVLLTCEIEEELRRVALPGRAERLKTRDAEELRFQLSTSRLLAPEHANLMRLDTTHLPPAEAAEAILARVAEVGS